MADKTVTRKITESALVEGRRRGLKLIYDTECKGFAARFNTDGSITFLYRYRSKATNKRPAVKAGTWSKTNFTAADARDRVEGWRRMLAEGREPRIELEKQEEAEKQQKAKIAASEDRKLSVFVERHFEPHMKRNKLGHQDIQRIHRRFSSWLDRDITELSKRDVTKWQYKWEQKGYAYNTLRRDYAVIQSLLNYAVDQEIIKANPLSGVRLKRPPAKTDLELLDETITKDRRALTKNEREALFRGLMLYTEEMKTIRRRSRLKKSNRHLPDWDKVAFVNYNVPAILTIYYTGFRNGDVFGLRWEHFDKNFTQINKVIEKTAHHDKGVMRFPIDSTLTDIIKTWWEQQGCPDVGYVFTNHKRPGLRLSSGALRVSWKRVKELAGLDENLDLYSLRHNFASQMIMRGASLKAVQELMGHSDIQTTMDHYSHLLEDHIRQEINKNGEVFGRFDIKKPVAE